MGRHQEDQRRKMRQRIATAAGEEPVQLLWKGKVADWFKGRSLGIADLVHGYIFSDHGVVLHTPHTCEASREMESINPLSICQS